MINYKNLLILFLLSGVFLLTSFNDGLSDKQKRDTIVNDSIIIDSIQMDSLINELEKTNNWMQQLLDALEEKERPN